jgi:hypothetical protein
MIPDDDMTSANVLIRLESDREAFGAVIRFLEEQRERLHRSLCRVYAIDPRDTESLMGELANLTGTIAYLHSWMEIEE